MRETMESGAPAAPRSRVGHVMWLLGNSPWIAIAALVHVILIAVMGIVYIRSETKRPPEAQTAVTLAAPPPQPLSFDPPESIERKAKDIPPVEDAPPGELNLRDDALPDSNDPGPRGDESGDPDDFTRDAGMLNENLDPPPDLPSGSMGSTSIGIFGPGFRGRGVDAFPGRGGGGPGGGGAGGRHKGGPSGGKQYEFVTPAALEWLKNHQSPDGRWDADGFDSRCRNGKCSGTGESVYDPGLTGLALLCFLGAGETHQAGPYKETVKNGLKYLRSIQDNEGCLSPRTSQHFQYNHACAALAMIEAYGMTQSKVWQEPAQKAIGFIQQSQNPYLAWRYGVRDGDNDTSVTGWMVMALKSGKMAGLDVDGGAFKGAVDWVDRMTDPEFGKVGYQQRGGLPARTTAQQDKFPANQSESLTAVGVLIRIFAGGEVAKDPMITKGAELMLKKPPRWDVDAGTIDFYYWYYGTLAMFQVGGKYWDGWNKTLKANIIDKQRRETERCEFGSWDPEDCWSTEGGRIYSTTLNCLSMEVFYRYPRVFTGAQGSGEKGGEERK